MQSFGEIMFTPSVQAEQAARGTRETYARAAARPAPEALGESSSVSVIVEEYGDAAAASNETVPVISLVPGSIDTPGGRPSADQVNPSPSGSTAVMVSETTSPSPKLCSPG